MAEHMSAARHTRYFYKGETVDVTVRVNRIGESARWKITAVAILGCGTAVVAREDSGLFRADTPESEVIGHAFNGVWADYLESDGAFSGEYCTCPEHTGAFCEVTEF